jgi:hypothetical protein
MKPEESEVKFWFNTVTKLVESGPQSLALNRLGPFDTEAQALRAEEIVAERARQIAVEDDEEDS